MRRAVHRLTLGELAAAGVAAVAVAAVAVLVGGYARGWWRHTGGTYAPRGILVQGHVTPPSSLFGDVVTVRADALVDARRVDPSSVEVAADFRPYHLRSESRRIERHLGQAALVEVRYEIQCVSSACLRLTSRGSAVEPVRLPPARVTARERGGGTLAARIEWPPFVVHSRLSSEEAGLSTPQLEPSFVPPAISWAVTPNLLGGLALGAAVLLVLGAASIVASILLADSRRLRRLRLPPTLTPVERALVLAEYATAQGEVAEGRKALYRLAIELSRAGERELAQDARALAWSTSPPSAARVQELARFVRSNGAG